MNYLYSEYLNKLSKSNSNKKEIYEFVYKHIETQIILFKNQGEREDFYNELKKILNQFSLVIAIEKILKLFLKYNKSIFDSEIKYITSFVDDVFNLYYENHYSDIELFEWYFNKGKNMPIKSMKPNEGIFVQTIHDAKGLEYDAVIIPFTNFEEKENLNFDTKWYKYQDMNGNYTLLLKNEKLLSETIFESEFNKEMKLKELDKLNLLYVAFTRAKEALIINAELKKAELKKKEKKSKKSKLSTNVISSIDDNQKNEESNKDKKIIEKIIDIIKKNSNNEFNSIININDNEIIIGTLNNNNNNNKSAIDKSKTLELFIDFQGKSSIIQFKDEEDYTNEKILLGIVYHEIFQKLDSLNNWKEKAILIIKKYKLSIEVEQQILQKVESLLFKNSELNRWFNESEKIISERSLLINKDLYRPDKIFILKNNTIIVDFKLDKIDEKKYKNQIKQYKHILKEMNYPEPCAYLLSIERGELIEV